VIVLDTNVLSELLRQRPAPAVVKWVAARPTSSLFTTTITQAEMLFGVALMPVSKRRSALAEAVTGLFDMDFAGRVLPFDGPAAQAFARLAAKRRQAGRSIGQLDAQIAGIVQSRGATLATRNIADFAGCGIEVVDPWHV
jgi:toxin FitB